MRRYLLLLVLGTMALAFGTAQAQRLPEQRLPEQRLPSGRAEIQLSFAPLVRQTAPAVVNVLANRIVRQRARQPLFEDPFFRRFFGFGAPGAPRQREASSVGSGVIVDPSGMIVTNHHVIEGADTVKVAFADRREFTATVVRDEPATDLAILQIDAGGEVLPFLPLADSDELEVGELVLAIGNPFGVGQTVTSGIVSALARTTVGISDFNFFIQTDAAINPGNSGGALVRMDGTLAGINTAIFSRDGGNQGVGFAIPANMVRAVLESVGEGGLALRPWLGARTQSVTSEIAAALGLERPAGALVSALYPGGPAERAGLEEGDVIVGFAGREIADSQSLRFRLTTSEIGGVARLKVIRKGATLTLRLALEAPPERPPANETLISGRNPFTGATVANRSPALSREMGLDPLIAGVMITKVARGSAAARIGFRRADMIRVVNGRRIGSVGDLVGLLDGGARQWRITIERDGRRLSVSLAG